MYHLRVPVFLLAALVLLRCIAAAPSHSPGSSSDEKENSLVDKESRSVPELISDLFVGLRGTRPERQVVITKSQDLTKLCNFGPCELMNVASKPQRLPGGYSLKERLEYLKKGGKRTNVGSLSFGKRDIHKPPTQ